MRIQVFCYAVGFVLWYSFTHAVAELEPAAFDDVDDSGGAVAGTFAVTICALTTMVR